MAGIRMSGMYSGIDTEAMIKDLMKAKSVKKDQIIKKKATLDFKQEAWKSLNAKIYTLFSKSVSDLRMSTSFRQLKTTVSDSSVASVISANSAPVTDQSLEVLSLAKTAYMTGGRVIDPATAGNVYQENANGSMQLSALGIGPTFDIPPTFDDTGTQTAPGVPGSGTGQYLEIKNSFGTSAARMEIKADTTINDVVAHFRNAGYTASFDSKNGRFYISAPKAGGAYDFTISMTDGQGVVAADSDTTLNKLGLDASHSSGGVNYVGSANKIEGTDARIELNGVAYTSSTNTFEINGLTITAKKTTNDPGGTGPVTLSTQRDTDAVYDTLKKFIKQYNELINEMDKLYNAPKNKQYEPLTSEEKNALSEKEVTDWEDKVKEAILSKDESLRDITSIMKSAMSAGVKVGTKVVKVGGVDTTVDNILYLSSFGISTAAYFNSADNEKGAYHIDGDKDDTLSGTADDKLKKLLASDPDTVEKFFTGLMSGMHEEINKKMSSTSYSSVYKVYNDKQMTDQSKKYEKELADLEVKLKKIEDNYYMKFSAMEKALGKLQSKQSALSGLMG